MNEITKTISSRLIEYGLSQYGAEKFAEQLVDDLGLSAELQWVPSGNGWESVPVPTFHDAELAMQVSPTLMRIDREFRIVSRWFRPSIHERIGVK